jgi:hypothetical protein
MPTREIPPSEWRGFFDTFSQLHEGWLITVAVSGKDVPGEQLEGDAQPFLGISADTKGSGAGAIEIAFGRDSSSEETHIVNGASHVLYEQPEGGGAESIEIQSAAGDTTILQFRPATETELPRAARG